MTTVSVSDSIPARKSLTAERLRAVVYYDAHTGDMTWIGPPIAGGRKLGDRIGTTMKLGYREAHIDGQRYLIHRLAWLYVFGEWPAAEIDHINGRRGDNRWTNLRPATHQENLNNSKRPSTNTSGYRGVCFDRATNNWRAAISLGNKTRFIGRFATKEEAYAAYCRVATETRGAFARLD